MSKPNILEKRTIPIADSGNQGGIRMWPSEDWASKLYGIANWFLIAALIVGAASTVLVVWMGNVKEAYLKKDLAATNDRAAHAEERAGKLEKDAGELRKAAEDERLARVELESKVSWRRLDSHIRSDAASHLILFANEPALVAYNANDIEASTFASDIAAMLHAAKWEVPEPLGMVTMREGPVPLGTNPHLPTGVLVWCTSDEASRKAATALVEQLSSRGFDATISPEHQNLLGIHPTPTRVAIFVEHKPEGAQGEYKLRAQKKAASQ
jgi:hypothetical protein